MLDPADTMVLETASLYLADDRCWIRRCAALQLTLKICLLLCYINDISSLVWYQILCGLLSSSGNGATTLDFC